MQSRRKSKPLHLPLKRQAYDTEKILEKQGISGNLP
jgi:hypothetical protein